MITTKTQAKFTEWLSAEEMHQASKKWYSELSFIKDEQLFFDDLIKLYTLQLLNENDFSNNRDIVGILNQSQKRTDELLEIVKTHSNELEIMVDGIDQPEEERNYKKEHRELVFIMSDFFINYKNLKTKLFDVFKHVLKESKKHKRIDNK